MAEFAEVLEGIRSETSEVHRMFDGDAGGPAPYEQSTTPVGRHPEARRGERRVGSRGQRRSPEYKGKLVEAARFLNDVYEGRRSVDQLREALTTSDFPNLFGDIIDRQLLANYMEAPYTFRQYCRIGSVRDFREVKRFVINGAEAVLGPVAQQDEYPEAKLTDGFYGYVVTKFGRKIPLAWETFVNDDLDALKDIPARFGKAARRSEEKFATSLFVDANGPNATFYSSGNHNIVTGSPALSINALQQAFTDLAAQRDADGEPITLDVVHLVVPPALEVVANNILHATQLWLNEQGGTADSRLITANWMANRTKISVNHYIPVIASGSHGNSSWFLFADPNQGRPALEVGFLRGHETPEVFVRDPDAMRLGGSIAPEDGNFDNDSIEYKVRHVFGGVLMDPKVTVASHG